MAHYRRWLVPGATFFFTVVVQDRRPLFNDHDAVRLLGTVMRSVRDQLPFQTLAIVVLPDHLHCVWSLPERDADYPARWHSIKRDFTFQWLRSGGEESEVSAARHGRGERGIWQRRFWEHCVRDERELEHCCDYVHYNPVKHGHARRPADWPWSTFSRFVRAGQYDPEWGTTLPQSLTWEIPGCEE